MALTETSPTETSEPQTLGTPPEVGIAGRMWRWFSSPPVDGPKAIIVLRLMAGGVFVWEGLLKFVFHNQGGGRFTAIGIPLPETMATFVALLEIGGGVLLLSGLFTRFISIPFIIEMVVAMLSTKIAIYLGTSPLPLPPAPPQTGFWAVLHEIRSEYAQLLTVIFLLIAGPGPWSLDALFARKRRRVVHKGGYPWAKWSSPGSAVVPRRVDHALHDTPQP
jgi:putative oxidoreductase